MTDAPSLSPPPLMLVAAAALTLPDGRVLLQRRPPGKPMAGLWEFPGGKLDPGETPEGALARELVEELGIAVDATDMTPLAFASGHAGERPLLLLLYRVSAWRGEPVALAAAELAWVAPGEMTGWPMPPADVPLVAALARASA